MSSRWYRSRLFWLGFAGFLVLTGLWLGHFRHVSHVTWSTGGTDYRVGWGNGEMGVGIVRHVAFVLPSGVPFSDLCRPRGLITGRDPVHPPARPHVLGADYHNGIWNTGIVIDLRFPVFLYTVLWLSALVLWQRRKHRLMTNPLDPA